MKATKTDKCDVKWIVKYICLFDVEFHAEFNASNHFQLSLTSEKLQPFKVETLKYAQSMTLSVGCYSKSGAISVTG